jgi:exodeoxyribonuclease V alpha subunit
VPATRVDDERRGAAGDQRLDLEVVAVRWRAPDGAFAVVAGSAPDGEVVAVGPLAHLEVGDAAELRGRFETHPRHGERFVARRVRVREPVSEDAVHALLSSVRHVGPRGAAWLLAEHGAGGVLAALDADPGARLGEVPGIGPARLPAAVRSWTSMRSQRALRLWLDAHGVDARAAARVLRLWGDGALPLLEADPYRLAEVDGVGFATADAVARSLGLAPDDPARLDAGLAHALREAEQDGHCLLPRPELERRARHLLGVAAGHRIEAAAAAGRLVVEEGASEPAGAERAGEAALVYDPRLHALEVRVARRAAALAADPPALGLGPVERPAGHDPPLSDEQWGGVAAALEHRLSILTGGPGTGKTASLRALVDLLRAHRRRVVLCAPTGKAARRVSEATGAEASTIHRLLEWVPGEGPARGEEDPLPADLVVVDEASMLTVGLADALLAAIGPRTHVLLVGDVDQLAPVGPGRVLEDLIASGAVPTTRLTTVFRQAARSLIVQAAHAINAGRRPRTRPHGDERRDFFVIARDDPAQVEAEAVELAARRLPAHYGLHPVGDLRVLSPMHRGPAGIDALNAALNARLNPDGERVTGGFRLGDPLLQTRNDYEVGLMNGETGVVLSDDPEGARLLLHADDGRRLWVPHRALDTLRLAHAMSIHKGQGSQAPAVVVALHRGHAPMLTRNLLYTGITRAERVCVLVADPAALDLALRRREARTRHTRLAARVRAALAAAPA